MASDEREGIWTITVRGDADLARVSELQVHLDAAYDRGYRAIVLDLSESGFIDSNFMHALWRFIARLHAARGDLAIACAPGHVRRSLEIFGVPSRASLYDDRDEAAAALSLGG